jgi:hypothetical protein
MAAASVSAPPLAASADSRAAATGPGQASGETQRVARASEPSAGAKFARAQAQNSRRHAEALRPFTTGEFGSGPASPTAAHIRAANRMIARLQQRLLQGADQIDAVAARAAAQATPAALRPLLVEKDRSGRWVKHVERIWDFYFELFGQRQSRFGSWLLASDRIALDCYQVIYANLGRPRSVPAPPPFSFMATGFTPSTYRRGVSLTRLGRRANPFPIVQLPHHRLVNPWTLGACHHEIAHNIQSDLGMWDEVPRQIVRRLVADGLPASLAAIWGRWNKEIWADLCGLLLGGPAIVASLIDVVAVSPRQAFGFNPAGVHPTPYLRVLINLALLRRMGFAAEADAFADLWQRLYPAIPPGAMPGALIATFPRAASLVVDTICYQPYRQLGGRRLAEVVSFNQIHHAMTVEAAARLAIGLDPGIVPARFLVGAARRAFDLNLAPPDRIASHFYAALVRR